MRRSLTLLKNAHPIQRVQNETDRYLEKKHKVLGKRHTIRHQSYHELAARLRDLNITSAFSDIQKAVYFLPHVEKEVEKTFLNDIKQNLTQPEKDELDVVYARRRKKLDDMAYLSHLKPLKIEVTDDPIPLERPDFEIPDLLNPREEDIGRFFTLNEESAKKLFMNGYFGSFINDHVARCGTFDVMMREETWRIINLAKNSQNVNGNSEDLSELTNLEPLQQLGWLISNHRKTYVNLHKNLSELVLDHVYSSENINLYHIMRNSAELFNSTVAVILQELSKSQLFRYFNTLYPYTNHSEYLSQVLKSDSLKEVIRGILNNYEEKIKDPKDILSMVHFHAFVEHISNEFRFTVNGEEFVIPLQQYVDDKVRFKVPKDLEQEIGKTGALNAGYLLSGHRGTGKSQILSGVAAWAHNEADYVLIKVPRGTDFTRTASPYFWEPNGLYIHPEIGFDLLTEILALNGEKLSQIPIDPKIYGKFSLSGTHPFYDKGYEPLTNQHVFMREEQFWTDGWKEYYDEEILGDMFSGIRKYNMHPRMSRFEYEMNQLKIENMPKNIRNLEEDVPTLLDDLELEDILNVDIPKRKPKKRMLPKNSAEDIKFAVKPKVIHAQDLATNNDDNLFPEDYTEPLTQVLPNPANLKELVEFGIKSHMHSVNVLFELMEHLYRTDKFKLMVLVDEFDSFYKPSDYPSLKYMNFRHFRECISPADISLSKLFMRFDGHMIRNGIKVVAVSEKEMNFQKRVWNGDPLNLGDHFCMEVENLALDDLRKMIQYYYFFDWTRHKMTQSDIATIYMQSQGNFAMALQNIAFSVGKTY